MATQAFSPRTRVDRRVVKFGCDAARASARGELGTTSFVSDVTIPSSGSKQAVLDGVSMTTESLRRRLPVLVFVPDRLAVVKGGPLVRRMYFDRMLGRLHPAAGDAPSDYAAALAQRNAALRRVALEVARPGSIDPWDRAVAELGTKLDAARADLVDRIAARFTAQCGSIGLDEATLSYEHQPVNEDDLAQARERDIRRRSTTVGPHLRDIAIRFEDMDLRGFGSQGQQRLAVLGLLLAEAETLNAERDVVPLILLDDVLSELDGDRRRNLLAALAPTAQTVLTTAVLDEGLTGEANPASVVRIERGTAIEAEAA